jgi:hypothetical protein
MSALETTYPFKITLGGITFNGPITIETALPGPVLEHILERLPTAATLPLTQVAAPEQPAPAVTTAPYVKSWDDLAVAKQDLPHLYKGVAPVGRRILVYVAQHGEDGCTFEDMKRDLADEGDIQRRMNTIFQVARRLRYLDKKGKGMAPWHTEYHNNKPMYTMNPELAEVILALSAAASAE